MSRILIHFLPLLLACLASLFSPRQLYLHIVCDKKVILLQLTLVFFWFLLFFFFLILFHVRSSEYHFLGLHDLYPWLSHSPGGWFWTFFFIINSVVMSPFEHIGNLYFSSAIVNINCLGYSLLCVCVCCVGVVWFFLPLENPTLPAHFQSRSP